MIWQVAQNVKKLIADLGEAKTSIEVIAAKYLAVAEALGRNAEPLVKEIQGIEKERAANKKAVHAEARRFARLLDASNRLINALMAHDAKKVASAKKRYAVVIANQGGVEKQPVSRAMNALWELARSSSWEAISIAEGQQGTMLIVKTYPIWKGAGTERHPREAARVAIMQMFDIDPDSGVADDSFFRSGPHFDPDDEYEED